MRKNDYIFLAGHKGLVGSSVYRALKAEGFKNIVTVDKKKLDLRNSDKTEKYFNKIKIDYMIMAAARAGGILANKNNQVNFFFENIEIQNSLLKLALKKKIKRTIFLGTSCIYPKFAKNPINEKSLLTGELEKTNQCYAISKIAGIKLCEALYEDHGLNILCLMPTNVYGINDKFDIVNGHVIPAMISKFIKAKKNNETKIKLLGTGKPIREFINSEDLAQAILTCLIASKKSLKKIFGENLPIINIGSGESVSIAKLAEIISYTLDYKGKIIFDHKSPDGTFIKNLNSKKIRKLGWKPKIKLRNGLTEVIKSKLK